MSAHTILVWVAFPFFLLSLGISFWSIRTHIKQYQQPRFQRLISRILIMIPIFATVAWVSLLFYNAGRYIFIFRDCYQAFVVATFFLLTEEYLGGVDQILDFFSKKEPIPQRKILCIERKPINLAADPRRSFMKVKRGVLQFAVAMPVIGLLTLVLDIFSILEPYDWSPSNAYLYLNIAQVIIVIVSMLSMHKLLNYLEDEIKLLGTDARIGAKFWCVKVTIFATFLQSIVISLIFFLAGANPEDVTPSTIQNFLLAIEYSIMAAIQMRFFPAREFLVEHGARLTSKQALRDILWPTDFMQETKRTFTSSNHSDVIDGVAPAETSEYIVSPTMSFEETSDRAPLLQSAEPAYGGTATSSPVATGDSHE